MSIERFEPSDRDGGELIVEGQKATVEAETERIGSILSEIVEQLPTQLPEDRARWFREKVTTLLFRKQNRSVWVEKSDYHSDRKNPGVLIRAFRIMLVPSTGEARPEWILNESADGEGVDYEPYLFDYDTEKAEGNSYVLQQGLRDPTMADMQEALRLIRESWELFREGREDAILYSSTPIPRVQRTGTT